MVGYVVPHQKLLAVHVVTVAGAVSAGCSDRHAKTICGSS